MMNDSIIRPGQHERANALRMLASELRYQMSRRPVWWDNNHGAEFITPTLIEWNTVLIPRLLAWCRGEIGHYAILHYTLFQWRANQLLPDDLAPLQSAVYALVAINPVGGETWARDIIGEQALREYVALIDARGVAPFNLRPVIESLQQAAAAEARLLRQYFHCPPLPALVPDPRDTWAQLAAIRVRGEAL